MMSKNKRFSYRAGSGFVEGLARIMDIGNTMNRYVTHRTAREADASALRSDWELVGQDIRQAIGELDETGMDQRKPMN